jgi:hypothetical protein
MLTDEDTATVFGPLKKALKGRTFTSDDNVQEAVVR